MLSLEKLLLTYSIDQLDYTGGSGEMWLRKLNWRFRLIPLKLLLGTRERPLKRGIKLHLDLEKRKAKWERQCQKCWELGIHFSEPECAAWRRKRNSYCPSMNANVRLSVVSYWWNHIKRETAAMTWPGEQFICHSDHGGTSWRLAQQVPSHKQIHITRGLPSQEDSLHFVYPKTKLWVARLLEMCSWRINNNYDSLGHRLLVNSIWYFTNQLIILPFFWMC